MPDLDEELIARAVRWCADAGRQATADQVRAALGPLSWDQLLAVRARLADLPPTRPLGPWALADLGRGTLPEVAADRERAGQYAPEEPPVAEAAEVVSPAPTRSPGRPAAGASGRARAASAPVIHRARDRVVDGASATVDRRAALPALFESEGRTVLERLVRRHGARRPLLLRALAEGWRRMDGADPTASDLEQLLQEHGLARTFDRRERDELLHALRASGGVLATAAARVGASSRAELLASLGRLGATEEAETIREVHRAEIRRRATLSERVRMLLADADRLEDLGVLGEIESDLRARIPEHLRALRASGARPLATALTQTLAMGPRELPVLLARLGLALDLGSPLATARPGVPRSGTPSGTQRSGRPRIGAARSGPPRPGTPRSGSARSGPPRSAVSRSDAPRSGRPRPTGRTGGDRPTSGGRAERGGSSRGPRSSGARRPRPSGPVQRPAGPRDRRGGPRSK